MLQYRDCRLLWALSWAVSLYMCGCEALNETSEGALAERPEMIKHSLSGQIAEIMPLEQYDGSAVVAAHDPRFVVVVVRIYDVSGHPPIRDGSMAYAIHSPTKTFGAPSSQVVGKWYKCVALSTTGSQITLNATEVEGPDLGNERAGTCINAR